MNFTAKLVNMIYQLNIVATVILKLSAACLAIAGVSYLYTIIGMFN